MDHLKTISLDHWQSPLTQEILSTSTQLLEQGHVLYFPSLQVPLTQSELALLTPDNLSPKRKNISWDVNTQRLRGCDNIAQATQQQLATLLGNYAQLAQTLVHDLFPQYRTQIRAARTSFRPGAITQRILSPRKDDRLLHVDAFPSTPLGESRLLRVFSNINPQGEPRVWCTSGPFSHIAKQFFPQLTMPWKSKGYLLRALGITRARRRAYDQLMLQLHNAMKKDTVYQTTTPKQKIVFPSGSTWIVFTDQVAHAALSGQYMLEQSFYFPVNAMLNPAQSPLRILENLFGRNLLM